MGPIWDAAMKANSRRIHVHEGERLYEVSFLKITSHADAIPLYLSQNSRIALLCIEAVSGSNIPIWHVAQAHVTHPRALVRLNMSPHSSSFTYLAKFSANGERFLRRCGTKPGARYIVQQVSISTVIPRKVSGLCSAGELRSLRTRPCAEPGHKAT